MSRSGARPPRVRVTVGATANCWAKPRNACGSSSSRQPQSWVIGVKFHMLSAKQARPNIISQRRSMRRARRCRREWRSTWNTPVENTAIADLERAEAAHPAEEERGQIDGREDADAGDEREEAAEREIAALERPQIDHRLGMGQAAPDEGDPGDRRDPGGRCESCRRRTSPSAAPPPACIRGSPGRAPSAPCRDSPRRAAAPDRACRCAPAAAPRRRRSMPGTRLTKKSQCQE